jgi:hypothetical protein
MKNTANAARAATGNCVLNSGTTSICSTSRANKNTFNPKP